MPTYNPKKAPGKYPMAFADALEKASHGAVGVEYRTAYKEFPAATRRLRVSQELSSFKASLRNYSAHRLASVVEEVSTRVEWQGQLAVIVSWKTFKPTGLLKGVL